MRRRVGCDLGILSAWHILRLHLPGPTGSPVDYAAVTMIAYLALGSNLGDRQAEIQRALRALAGQGEIEATSRVYETEPEGGATQPKYLNAVLRIRTSLSARSLLAICLDIERAQGRVRPHGGEKAPRNIDIDVLLCDSRVIDEPGLRVPHPRLLVRPFVRIPLADVARPGLCHPVTGDALDRCAPDPGVVPASPVGMRG
jgi:2-amino-4-hydroxy-6-hydroxymethyldihydropteridine diphosphokinase